jgi:hypothetical protein
MAAKQQFYNLPCRVCVLATVSLTSLGYYLLEWVSQAAFENLRCFLACQSLVFCIFLSDSYVEYRDANVKLEMMTSKNLEITINFITFLCCFFFQFI